MYLIAGEMMSIWGQLRTCDLIADFGDISGVHLDLADCTFSNDPDPHCMLGFMGHGFFGVSAFAAIVEILVSGNLMSDDSNASMAAFKDLGSHLGDGTRIYFEYWQVSKNTAAANESDNPESIELDE